MATSFIPARPCITGLKIPIQYEFNFVNASNAVQNALDNALLYAPRRYKVDDVLTRESPVSRKQCSRE